MHNPPVIMRFIVVSVFLLIFVLSNAEEIHQKGGVTSEAYAYLYQEFYVPIPKPYPVRVEKNIPVPYPVKVPVHVDNPVPVYFIKFYPVFEERKVPYPVEKQIPVPVNVQVPVPYPVKVPVHIEKPYPVHIAKNVPYIVKNPYIVEKKIPIYIKKYHHGHE